MASLGEVPVTESPGRTSTVRRAHRVSRPLPGVGRDVTGLDPAVAVERDQVTFQAQQSGRRGELSVPQRSRS